MNRWAPEPVDVPLGYAAPELAARLRFAICLLLAVAVPMWLLEQALEQVALAHDDFGRAYWMAECDKLIPGLGDRLALWWEAAP